MIAVEYQTSAFFLKHNSILKSCSILQEEGLTALHYAVLNGHTLCVEAICANDTVKNKQGLPQSCINIQSSVGFTALHLAASEGLNAGEVMEVLLLSGVDPTLLDNLGRTALDLACEKQRLGKDSIGPCIQSLGNARIEVESIVKFRSFLKQKHQVKPRGQLQALDDFDGGGFAQV